MGHRSVLLCQQRTPRRSRKVPVNSGGTPIHRQNDMTRNLHPCESTRTTHQGTHSKTLCNGTSSMEIFALNQNRRNSPKKSRGGRVGSQYIHRCLVRRRRVTITDGSNDNLGEPADRKVQSEAGGSLTIDYGSRIYSGLRRSEGCGLDPGIPKRIRNKDQSHTPYGQRRSIQPQQEIEVRQQIRTEKLHIKTIPGKDNPADFLTKLLPMSSVNSWKERWMSTTSYQSST